MMMWLVYVNFMMMWNCTYKLGLEMTTLGINMDEHSTLISTLILQKLPNVIKLIVNKQVKDAWDLNKIIELVNLVVEARGAYASPRKFQEDKNLFDNTSRLLYTG